MVSSYRHFDQQFPLTSLFLCPCLNFGEWQKTKQPIRSKWPKNFCSQDVIIFVMIKMTRIKFRKYRKKKPVLCVNFVFIFRPPFCNKRLNTFYTWMGIKPSCLLWTKNIVQPLQSANAITPREEHCSTKAWIKYVTESFQTKFPDCDTPSVGKFLNKSCGL